MFTGLSAFPITPTTADGDVIGDDLRALLARLRAAGVDSVGLLGSTGSYAYLDRAARLEAVRIAAAALGDLPLIVSVGAMRTDMAAALARDAAGAGAGGLLLAPVSYTPLTQDEAYHHYRTVAAATDLPLCIYNNPSTTRFQFSHDLLARLADLPNIKAVKMPLPSGTIAADMAALAPQLPADFLIGYSGDWGCAEALLAGAAAWYSVAGGILPAPALALTRAAQAGDTAQTNAINARFAPLWALFQTHGSLRVVYAMAHIMGLTQAAPPLPIMPLPAPLWPAVAEALAPLLADQP